MPPSARCWSQSTDVNRSKRRSGFPLRCTNRVVHHGPILVFPSTRLICYQKRTADNPKRAFRLARQDPQPSVCRLVGDAYPRGAVQKPVFPRFLKSTPDKLIAVPGLFERSGPTANTRSPPGGDRRQGSWPAPEGEPPDSFSPFPLGIESAAVSIPSAKAPSMNSF